MRGVLDIPKREWFSLYFLANIGVLNRELHEKRDEREHVVKDADFTY